MLKYVILLVMNTRTGTFLCLILRTTSRNKTRAYNPILVKLIAQVLCTKVIVRLKKEIKHYYRPTVFTIYLKNELDVLSIAFLY